MSKRNFEMSVHMNCYIDKDEQEYKHINKYQYHYEFNTKQKNIRNNISP